MTFAFRANFIEFCLASYLSIQLGILLFTFLQFKYIFVKCKSLAVGRRHSHVSNLNFFLLFYIILSC